MSIIGYAIGYHMVQHYLQRTGRSAVEAIFLSSQEIIAESGFFDEAMALIQRGDTLFV